MRAGRHSGWRRPALILAYWGAAAAACVPRGDPPQGRQIVADRIAVPVYILPARGDGTTRVLVTRPAQSAALADLSVVSVDDTGSPPVERLLAANARNGTCYARPLDCYPTDAQGRLLVYTADPARPPNGSLLARIDPVTGDRVDLGPADYHQLSASGARLLVVRTGTTPTLYEADDQGVPLAGVTNSFHFLGEVLYAITDQKELIRVAAGAGPELIATAVDSAAPLPMDADQHPLLGIQRGTGLDATRRTLSFLDTVTLAETPCPAGSRTCTISPDGRWLVAAADAITITDRIAGTTDVLPTAGDDLLQATEARPAHEEIWLTVRPPPGATTESSIWIKKAGSPPVQTSEQFFGVTFAASTFPLAREGRAFTEDGAYWFIPTRLTDDKLMFQVGSADDLNAPRFDVVPAGSNYSDTWLLPDNLLVTPIFNTTNDRANVYVVDPATGQSRVLGEDGVLMAIGQTRLLVNQHHIQNTGDLTVFDLATSQATVLAPEFALTAVVEARDQDAVAPGAPIAFQFQARFASTYDGIWLATVP